MVGYQCQRVGESVCCAKFNFFLATVQSGSELNDK